MTVITSIGGVSVREAFSLPAKMRRSRVTPPRCLRYFD